MTLLLVVVSMLAGAALFQLVEMVIDEKRRSRPPTEAEKDRARVMAWEAKARSSDVRRGK